VGSDLVGSHASTKNDDSSFQPFPQVGNEWSTKLWECAGHEPIVNQSACKHQLTKMTKLSRLILINLMDVSLRVDWTLLGLFLVMQIFSTKYEVWTSTLRAQKV
jgi:hypothetical protein